MPTCVSVSPRPWPASAFVRCISAKSAELTNQTQPSLSRLRSPTSSRPRVAISSVKPTSSSTIEAAKKPASYEPQSVLARLMTSATTMSAGTKIGQRALRSRSNSAGRHQPSTLAVMARKIAPTMSESPAPRKSVPPSRPKSV